jgi:hypothetical protein
MAEVFVGRFITNSQRRKGLDTLMMIKLGDNESIKDYSARFGKPTMTLIAVERIQHFKRSNWVCLLIPACVSP